MDKPMTSDPALMQDQTVPGFPPMPMNVQSIMDIIPHRYPFIMVDRVTLVVPGERIEGIKNVTINEAFFQGHFPEHPIMPGVLQLEALGQLAGLLVSAMPEGKGKMGLFTGMNNIKFRRMVTPGDQLQLIARVQKIRLPLCKFNVEARVDGLITVEGELSFSMVDKAVL
jgi:3-hydroxyacyl-[acyl-carrier-protein] dehydratase